MKRFAVAALSALLISACAGQYDEPRLDVPDDTGSEAAPSELARTVPVSDDYHLDTTRALQGSIAFMRDDDLLRVNFDGSPAQIIAEGVEVRDVSPGGEMVIYFDPRDDMYYGLTVATGKTWPITWEYTMGRTLFGPWSLDGRWTIVQNETVDGHIYEQTIVGVDGTLIPIPPPEVYLVSRMFPDTTPVNKLDPVPLEQYRALHWLEDGRLLVIFYNFELENPRAFADFIDPVSGTFTPGDEALTPHFGALFSRIRSVDQYPGAKGYLLAYVEEFFTFRLAFEPQTVMGTTVYHPAQEYAVVGTVEGQSICKIMHLFLKPVRDAFFPTDIYNAVVADAAPLVLRAMDPAVFSVQTVAPNCDEGQVWQRVVRVSLDDPYEAETVFRTGALGPGIPEAHIAQSTEVRVVIWSTRSAAEERASLLLTDLVSGETEEILAARYNSATDTGTLDVLAWSW